MSKPSMAIRQVAFLLPLLGLFLLVSPSAAGQSEVGSFSYAVTLRPPYYHVELSTSWNSDTLRLKMPQWTPGYYQIMNYWNAVENFSVKEKNLVVKKTNDNTWEIVGSAKQSITISYDVKAERQFVAHSKLDTAHGYIVPAGVFMYPEGSLNTTVRVKLDIPREWKVATGLESAGKNEFSAPHFDILYDCPILMGKLEELPGFSVRGVDHRFIAYKPGNFDRATFMKNLEKVVIASVNIMDHIPFKGYTFIGIGPGRGGIEHLNNTTVSFDGSNLDSPEPMTRMMNFLAHEYFHHYNVKRIRPMELGPFDYDKGSRTNLLWVSEGLTVYYEYLIVKRAGLIDEATFLSLLSKNITATENNPGKMHQSLAEASYATWSDGPFGTQGKDPGKAISYYDKGPIVGMVLDLAIRHASQNKKSLDDVMRLLYNRYARELDRGFTDAEFQQACETIAGAPLTDTFEYVYTTKEIDYNTYLGYAGLKLSVEENAEPGKGKKHAMVKVDQPAAEQAQFLRDWLKN